MVNHQGDEIGEPSMAIAGNRPNETTKTTESIPQMLNFELGKAACIEDSISMLEADGTFCPDELLKWRAPIRDDLIRMLPIMKDDEDEFVVLYLAHILHGLRVDASEFLVSVLAHYGIEWHHLTPDSITVLSMFAHLCEAFMAVVPTLEVFVHFYRLYPNKQGGTMATLGGAYFQLRDSMKKNYPMYHMKATRQDLWCTQWFYAKLPQSCRLTFRGDELKEAGSWKDLLVLSPDQEQQVVQIAKLSKRGLTGVDIIRDYLKLRISPLRRKMHLACKYTGPADPTRDPYKDFSVEDIESKLSYLLDLKKMGMLPSPSRPNVPTSLIEAPDSEGANEPLVFSSKGRKITKRKPFAFSSRSKKKTKYSSLRFFTKTSGSVSNVLLDQPVRDSSPKEVDPNEQPVSEREDQEATEEPAPTPVHSTEETNNDMQMQEVCGEVLPLSEAAYTNFLEQAEKLVLANKHLVQQVKDQRQMIDELNKKNKSIKEAFVQKCTEVDLLKEKTTKLITDREVMQSRVCQ